MFKISNQMQTLYKISKNLTYNHSQMWNFIIQYTILIIMKKKSENFLGLIIAFLIFLREKKIDHNWNFEVRSRGDHTSKNKSQIFAK